LLWSLAIVILAVAVLGIGLWDRHQAEQTKLAKQQVEQTKLAKQQVERAKAEKQQAEKQKAEQEENDRQYAEWKRKSDKWWSVTKKIEARFDQLQQEYTTRDFSNCRSAHELDQEENRLLDKARTAETEIHDMMADMSSADFPGSFDLFKVVTEFFAHHRAMIGSDATLFHTVVMLGRWDDDWEKKAHEEHLACNKAMLALISVRGFSGLPFLPKKK
jgi:DNA segregation ATPase FtsK/SpoIIIE-like protein